MILLLIYILSIMGTLVAYSVYEDDFKDFRSEINVEKVILLVSVIPLINTIITLGTIFDCFRKVIKFLI